MSQKGLNYYYQEPAEESLYHIGESRSSEEALEYRRTSFMKRNYEQVESTREEWNSSLQRSNGEAPQDPSREEEALVPCEPSASQPSATSEMDEENMATNNELPGADFFLGMVFEDEEEKNDNSRKEYFQQQNSSAEDATNLAQFGTETAGLLENVSSDRQADEPSLAKTAVPVETKTPDKEAKEEPEIITLGDSDWDDRPEVITIDDSDSQEADCEIVSVNLTVKNTDSLDNDPETISLLAKDAVSDQMQDSGAPMLSVEIAGLSSDSTTIPLPKFNLPKAKASRPKTSEADAEPRIQQHSEDSCNLAVGPTPSCDTVGKHLRKKVKRKRRHLADRRERLERISNLKVENDWFENIYHSKWNRHVALYYCTLTEAMKQLHYKLDDIDEVDLNSAMDMFIKLLNDLNLGGTSGLCTSTEECNSPTNRIVFDKETTIPWSSKRDPSYPPPHPYEEWVSRMRMRMGRYLETGIDTLGWAGCCSTQWTTEIDLCRTQTVNVNVTLGDMEYSIVSFVDSNICFSVSVTAPTGTKKWAESVCLQVYCNGYTTKVNATLHRDRLTATMLAEDGLPKKCMVGRVRLTLSVASIQFSLPAPTNSSHLRIPKMKNPIEILHNNSSFLYFACQNISEFTSKYGRDVRLLASILKLTGTSINDKNVVPILAFADYLRIETLHYACEQYLIESKTIHIRKRILVEGFMLPNLERSLDKRPRLTETEPAKPIEKVPPIRIYKGDDNKSWRIRQENDAME